MHLNYSEYVLYRSIWVNNEIVLNICSVAAERVPRAAVSFNTIMIYRLYRQVRKDVRPSTFRSIKAERVVGTAVSFKGKEKVAGIVASLS